MWYSRQASVTTFPHVSMFTKDEDSAKTASYGVLSDLHIYGLFVPFPPPVLIGITQVANISLEAGFGPIMFLSDVFVVFHSWYQSTLIIVPPSIRPL